MIDETKLNLSCEYWCAYDCCSMEYKRGWRPKKLADYTGLSMLILIKTYN